MGIDISPMPVRHGQTPARRLHLPESECSGAPDTASSSAIGVVASRQSAPSEKEQNVCGGLPTRRYGAGASSAVPLKPCLIEPNERKKWK